MSRVNVELAQAKKNIRTSAKVFKVMQIITAVLAVIAAVMILVCLIGQNHINNYIDANQMKEQITVDTYASFNLLGIDLTYPLADKVDSKGFGMAFSALFAGVAAVLVIATIVFNTVYQVLKAVYEGDSPFKLDTLNNIRKGFIAVVVVLVLTSGIMNGILVGLVLWSIYSVFKYGCALQQEADETL